MSTAFRAGNAAPNSPIKRDRTSCVAQRAQVVFAELRRLEHPMQYRRYQLGFAPRRERAPGAPQGDAHVAIAQPDRNRARLGCPRRREQLRTGQYAQGAAELALVRGQHEVEQQRRELAIADDRAQVERLELPALRQRIIASGVELDADAVRLGGGDHPLYRSGRFTRNVRRAHQ